MSVTVCVDGFNTYVNAMLTPTHVPTYIQYKAASGTPRVRVRHESWHESACQFHPPSPIKANLRRLTWALTSL